MEYACLKYIFFHNLCSNSMLLTLRCMTTVILETGMSSVVFGFQSISVASPIALTADLPLRFRFCFIANFNCFSISFITTYYIVQVFLKTTCYFMKRQESA